MFVQFPSKVDPKKNYRYLAKHQFDAELERCLQCRQKPCQKGCPCKCSPADFIQASMGGSQSDIDLAALEIYSKVPIGSICGTICPSKFCMAKCSRTRLDAPINIPGVQAEITRRANKTATFKKYVKKLPSTGKKVAIIGAGPSGLSAAACLASRGHSVIIFEKNSKPGGDLTYIPTCRFPADTIDQDVEFIKSLGDVEIKYGTEFKPESTKDYDAVIYAVGQQIENKLSCPGAELSITPRDFLMMNPEELKDKNVAIIGCGAVAIDAATFATKSGAEPLILYRRTVLQAPLSTEERGTMDSLGIAIVPRIGVVSLEKENGKITVNTQQLDKEIKPIPNTDQKWRNFDMVVPALGQRSTITVDGTESGNVFVCGQARGKGLSAVEAAASGKNAAMKAHALLSGEPIPTVENEFVCAFPTFEVNRRPADISVTYQGLKLQSPFVAGASPFTETLDQCRALLKEGFGGVIIGAGSAEKFSRTYRKGKEPLYIPTAKPEEVAEMVNTLKKEFPNAVIGTFLNAGEVNICKAIRTLSVAHFIQVDRFSTSDIKHFQIPVGINVVYTIRGQGCGEITFGVKNYHDVLGRVSHGCRAFVVDPNDLDRCTDDIGILCDSLSVAIDQDGCASFEDWIAKHPEQFDIEEMREEKLVNHLTNPYACLGCGRCTNCPNDAIDLVPEKWRYVVDPDKCVGCGLCESRCPTNACSLITRAEAEELKKKTKHW